MWTFYMKKVMLRSYVYFSYLEVEFYSPYVEILDRFPRVMAILYFQIDDTIKQQTQAL